MKGGDSDPIFEVVSSITGVDVVTNPKQDFTYSNKKSNCQNLLELILCIEADTVEVVGANSIDGEGECVFGAPEE